MPPISLSAPPPPISLSLPGPPRRVTGTPTVVPTMTLSSPPLALTSKPAIAVASQSSAFRLPSGMGADGAADFERGVGFDHEGAAVGG